MKRWAWVTIILYGVIFIVVTIPVIYLAFLGTGTKISLKDMAENWNNWAVLAIFLLCQAALLLVPVRITDKRPVTRSSIITCIVGAAFMAGLLVAGVIVSVGEIITKYPFHGFTWWLSLGVLVIMWIVWGTIFRKWAKALEPRALIERQSRFLYRGSILELLIAIPAHVIARNRDYCCAGVSTLAGIIFGIAVMLFSFGPGVYFLFAERLKNSRKKSNAL